MKRGVIALTLITIMLLGTVVWYCGGSVRGGGSAQASWNGIMTATATGSDYNEAAFQAKRDSLKLGIIELIGQGSWNANEDILTNTFLTRSAYTEYMINDERMGKSDLPDGNVSVTYQCTWDVDAIKARISSLGLSSGQARQSTTVSEDKDDGVYTAQTDTEVRETQPPTETPSEPTGPWDEVFGNYTFVAIPDGLVSVSDLGRWGFAQGDFAVEQVNRFLAENHLEFVNMDRLQQIMQDSATVQDDMLGGLTIPQIIAMESGADIYLEVGLTLQNTRPQAGMQGFMGSVLISAYESSTARGLGAADAARSAYSQSEAEGRKRVLMDAVPVAMEDLLPMVSGYIGDGLARKFNVIFFDVTARDGRTIKRELEADSNFEEVKQLNYADGKLTYEIMYKGPADELMYAIFDALEREEDYEDIDMCYQRLNEMHFYAGGCP